MREVAVLEKPKAEACDWVIQATRRGRSHFRIGRNPMTRARCARLCEVLSRRSPRWEFVPVTVRFALKRLSESE